MFNTTYKRLTLAAVFLFLALTSQPVSAHVKWFSNFSFADPPRPLSAILNPTVIGLAIFSAIVIGVLVPIDLRLAQVSWYQRINQWLESYSDEALLIMRVGTGAVMLMVWQADALLAPELGIPAPWLGWVQFIIALLLLFRTTTPIAGVGVIALYFVAMSQYGLFHMLDYVHYLGVGAYLLVTTAQNPRISGLGLPALYLGVGFSLCWVALEKLVYPEWGLYILQNQPQLTMGFDPSFFLTGAAFVELSLGFLLIICLLQRPLALVITLVFFTTTTFFGKTEVIGHTLLHAALLVFLVEGPGRFYKAPITFHERTPLRIAFASVNFLLLVGILLIAYTYVANQEYQLFINRQPDTAVHEVSDTAQRPSLTLTATEAAGGGWNLQLNPGNFVFSSPNEEEFVMGEGYGTLYINGDEVGRIYDEWYYIPNLRPGNYQLMVVLNGNDHGSYVLDGNPIAAMTNINVTP